MNVNLPVFMTLGDKYLVIENIKILVIFYEQVRITFNFNTEPIYTSKFNQKSKKKT